ncbi:MAG: hypothetical protein PHX43_08475 [Alphaproteobacteria bacterium]|nr:hypothetical protein [Alphaproteobacteria bacterium]
MNKNHPTPPMYQDDIPTVIIADDVFIKDIHGAQFIKDVRGAKKSRYNLYKEIEKTLKVRCFETNFYESILDKGPQDFSFAFKGKINGQNVRILLTSSTSIATDFLRKGSKHYVKNLAAAFLDWEFAGYKTDENGDLVKDSNSNPIENGSNRGAGIDLAERSLVHEASPYIYCISENGAKDMRDKVLNRFSEGKDFKRELFEDRIFAFTVAPPTEDGVSPTGGYGAHKNGAKIATEAVACLTRHIEASYTPPNRPEEKINIAATAQLQEANHT